MIQPEPGRFLFLCHKVLSILSLPQSILANMLARAAASISDFEYGTTSIFRSNLHCIGPTPTTAVHSAGFYGTTGFNSVGFIPIVPNSAGLTAIAGLTVAETLATRFRFATFALTAILNVDMGCGLTAVSGPTSCWFRLWQLLSLRRSLSPPPSIALPKAVWLPTLHR